MMADAFVLDMGVRAYRNWVRLADGMAPQVGDRLSGRLSLAVDPFFYMDEFARRPGMPALIYSWTIEEIQIDRTPQVRVDPGDRRYPSWLPPGERHSLVRDDTRETWENTDRTRRWEDNGSYRLRCTLHSEPPRDSMPTRRRPLGPH
jgi:hypothetical protein